MRKTFAKRTVIAAVAALFMSFTAVPDAEARKVFVYGENGNELTVSTLNADGVSITPRLRYVYGYDADGNLAQKKAYRWNPSDCSWSPAYLLNYISGGNVCLIDYAEWDKQTESFSQNCRSVVHCLDMPDDLLLTEVKK